MSNVEGKVEGRVEGMKFGGYVYELGGDALDWQSANEGLWRVVMTTSDNQRAVHELGVKYFDNQPCIVFLCADARVRAVQMKALESKR